MFCKNCGKEIENGVTFCSNCGSAINDGSINNTVSNENGITPKKKPSIFKSCLIVIGATFGIIIVLSILMTILIKQTSSIKENVSKKSPLSEAMNLTEEEESQMIDIFTQCELVK